MSLNHPVPAANRSHIRAARKANGGPAGSRELTGRGDAAHPRASQRPASALNILGVGLSFPNCKQRF